MSTHCVCWHHVKQRAAAKTCLKERKPYKCSEAQRSDILRQKQASAQRLAQWEIASGAQLKTCHVCDNANSLSEFKRVRKNAKFQAVGSCHACEDPPNRPAALARLRMSNSLAWCNWYCKWY